MKRILLSNVMILITIIGLVMLSVDLFSQCASKMTLENAKHIATKIRKDEGQLNNRSGLTFNIQLKFHVARTDAGTGGPTDSQITTIISRLNYDFSDSKIQFYKCGSTHYINNSNYYAFDETADEAGLVANNYENNKLNIYVVNEINDGAEKGYTPFFNTDFTQIAGNKATIFITTEAITDTDQFLTGSLEDHTLSHEMGHFFSLIHTHGLSNACNSTDEPVDRARDSDNNGTPDCAETGDYLCLTPADPNLSPDPILFCGGGGRVGPYCNYEGDQKEPGSGMIVSPVDNYNVIYDPDPKNIMSYAKPGCRDTFTSDQIDRMNIWANEINYLFANCGCADEIEDIEVDADDEWEYLTLSVGGNLIIKENVKLNIKNSELKLFSDSKIIIERGGLLILDNTKLKSACSSRWQGIEAWGTSTSSMPTNPTPAQLTNLTGFTNNSDKGMLVMYNSTIENAEEAFRNHRIRQDGWSNPDYIGGVIYAKDGIFLNCWRSAEFLKHSSVNNSSKFDNCEFIISDNFIITGRNYASGTNDLEPLRHFITMWSVEGVSFINNTFTNNYSGLLALNKGTGIKTIDASYSLLPGNTFSNLSYGIEASDEGGISNGISIISSTFNQVYRAISAKGVNALSISNCTMNIPSGGSTKEDATWGVKIEAAEGFGISNNDFIGASSSGNYTYGVIITNSGYLFGGSLNGNLFNDLSVGTQTEGFNVGTLITCNEYERTTKAWWINPEAVPFNNGFIAYLCADGAVQGIGDQGTGCGNTNIQVDNIFKDQGVTHITTYVPFDYVYNFDPDFDIPVATSSCVNVTQCSIGTPKCSNISSGSSGSDFLTMSPNGLKGIINAASQNGESQRLMGEIINVHLKNNKPEKIIKLLELINDEESRKLLVPTYIHNKEFEKGRHTLNSISVDDDDTRSFKKIYDVQLELYEQGKPLTDFANDPKKIQDVVDVANDETKYSYVAQRLLELTSYEKYWKKPEIGNEMIPSVQQDNYSNINLFIAKIKPSPNPARQNVLVEYTPGNATEAKLNIRETISGNLKDSYTLDVHSRFSTIDVSSYPSGIYLLELLLDNQFAARERLVIIK